MLLLKRLAASCVFWLLLFFQPTLICSYEWDVAICAIFRDEAPYLREWIEFHRLVGVEHFFLYNHLSKDNYLEVLRPYINEGIVDLVDWSRPIDPKNPIPSWCSIQSSAYNQCIKKNKTSAKWIAFIDTDEFLFPVVEDSLNPALERYEKAGAVCVNWQMYGTSHISKIPSNMLQIEALTYKSKTQLSPNRHIKSIVRPSRVRKFLNAHFPLLKQGFWQVDTDGRSFEGAQTPYVKVDKIRINHYWTRDEDYLYNVKLPSRKQRGRNQSAIAAEQFYNQVEDRVIFRFVPALRERVFD